MPKAIDETGNRHGRLTVVSSAGTDKWGQKMWDCVCDCGGKCTVTGGNLRVGHTTSCGCVQTENRVKHGFSDTRLYSIWEHIISRCANPKDHSYKNYGGRGIEVCQDWRDAGNFITWALANGYSDKLQIDRIDNEGDYEPSNCRWVTPEINSNNQRTRKDNTSGYTGVVKTKSNKFSVSISSIRLPKKYAYLGIFPTAWEACEARNEFIRKHNLPHKIQERICAT